jgi:hypothetical protein
MTTEKLPRSKRLGIRPFDQDKREKRECSRGITDLVDFAVKILSHFLSLVHPICAPPETSVSSYRFVSLVFILIRLLLRALQG